VGLVDNFGAGQEWLGEPFRTYASAPRIELDLLADRVTSSYGDLFQIGAIPPQSISVETIGILFELSLGLSAWKQYEGSRWALRCNPSSGNLHPTEGYLEAGNGTERDFSTRCIAAIDTFEPSGDAHANSPAPQLPRSGREVFDLRRRLLPDVGQAAAAPRSSALGYDAVGTASPPRHFRSSGSRADAGVVSARTGCGSP